MQNAKRKMLRGLVYITTTHFSPGRDEVVLKKPVYSVK